MLSGFDSGGVHQVRDLPRELLDLRIELTLAGRPLVRRSPILRQVGRSRGAGLGCQRTVWCGGGRAEGGGRSLMRFAGRGRRGEERASHPAPRNRSRPPPSARPPPTSGSPPRPRFGARGAGDLLSLRLVLLKA